MKHNLLKNIVFFLILILFFGISIFPNIMVAGENKTVSTNLINFHFRETNIINTIYVDDDNTDGPWDGTMEHPYQYIQDAIDNSPSGSTICVWAGIYYENIVIYNENMIILGNGSDSTVIDGGKKSDVVKIINDRATIEGFTIQNCGHLDNGVVTASSYALIKRCLIKNNYNGIQMMESQANYNTIEECTISNNTNIGVYVVDSCMQNTITGCTIEKCFWGIVIVDSRKIDIRDSTIQLNIGGLILQDPQTSECLIMGNTFRNNTKGIWLWAGAYRNDIYSNNFLNNDQHATFTYCRRNDWSRNYWDPRLVPKPGSRTPYIIFGIAGSPLTPWPFWINFDMTPNTTPHPIKP